MTEFVLDDLLNCFAVPEEEDPGYQGIQHDGEEQRDHVENGKIDEVNGQVELPLHSVSTLHMPILAHLNITPQPLLTISDAVRKSRSDSGMRFTQKTSAKSQHNTTL